MEKKLQKLQKNLQSLNEVDERLQSEHFDYIEKTKKKINVFLKDFNADYINIDSKYLDIGFLLNQKPSIFLTSKYSTSNYSKISISNKSTDDPYNERITIYSDSFCFEIDKKSKKLDCLNFLNNELHNNDSKFFKMVKRFFKKSKKQSDNISNIIREKNDLTQKINKIKYKIEFNNFFKKIKVGNFYISLNPSTHIHYNQFDVFHIKQINGDNIEFGYRRAKFPYIKKYIIDQDDILRTLQYNKRNFFNELGRHTHLIDEDNIGESLMDLVIGSIIKKMDKNDKYYTMIKDIKQICKFLHSINIIDEKIPNNEILSIISKHRHYYLKSYKKKKEEENKRTPIVKGKIKREKLRFLPNIVHGTPNIIDTEYNNLDNNPYYGNPYNGNPYNQW